MAAPPSTRCAAVEYGLTLIKEGVPPRTAWGLAAKEYGVHRASLYRWFNRVEGAPREEWPAILESKYRGRQPAPFSDAAWEFFLREYQATQPPSIKEAYRATAVEAKQRGWAIPSEVGVRRRMDREAVPRRSRYDDL
jgi:hypothetical protein